MHHRVLIIAEAANPQWVSVPLVGWFHARELMKVCDAHLVTQVRNRQAILETGKLIEGEQFTSIDSEAVARKMHKISEVVRGKSGVNWTAATAFQTLAYPYFERLVWEQFGERIRKKEFDVVHRITPLSPATPSSLAKKCKDAGVPFVLGPLNGGVPWPKGFSSVQRREKEWLSHVRGLYKVWPGYRSTRDNSAAILVGSRTTFEQVPDRYRDKTIYMPENAIDPTRFKKPRTRTAGLPLRGIFVGRLVPLKGLDMLLESAVDLFKSGKLTLEIVGDGQEMAASKDFVARHGIQSAVTFAGWLQHEQVLDRLADNDLFLLPSIREFGGGAALEAMAVGLPAVVLNYGGPGELVTEGTGFLVEMGSRAQIVQRLREVLTYAVEHPELVEQKSKLAYRRAHEQFTWSAKVQQTLAVYDWVTGRGSKPQFPMPTPDPT